MTADRIPLRTVPTFTDRLNDARACHTTDQQHRHDDGDLTARLAAALTDATNLAHTHQTPPDTRIARWRALLAEHAETQP